MPTTIQPIAKPNCLVFLFTLSLALEYYDFVIYGIFAMYFDEQFFPKNNPIVSLMFAYAVFTIGYLSRPIGGIFFAHLSYKYNKVKVMLMTMILMGLSVLGIALLPTYAQIGILAPLIMILLRVLHGLSLGGDIPIASTYLYDNYVKKRPLYLGILFSGIGFGMLLAGLINSIITSTLDKPQLYQFGWRIPFAFGSVLCILSYIVRQVVLNIDIHKEATLQKHIPLIIALKNYSPLLILGILILGIQGILSTVTQIYMPSYLINILHYKPADIAYSTTIGNLAVAISAMAIGYLTYKFWQQQQLIGIIIPLVSIVLFYYPLYSLIIHHQYFSLAITLISIIKGMVSGIALFITMLIFPNWLRITGIAICYNFGILIFAGFSPFVVTYLIHITHDVYMPAYLCIGYSLFLLSVLYFWRNIFKTEYTLCN